MWDYLALLTVFLTFFRQSDAQWHTVSYITKANKDNYIRANQVCALWCQPQAFSKSHWWTWCPTFLKSNQSVLHPFPGKLKWCGIASLKNILSSIPAPSRSYKCNIHSYCLHLYGGSCFSIKEFSGTIGNKWES